jgi:phosphatidylserine synthase
VIARRSQRIDTDVASPALLTRLSVADWLSLVALLFAWWAAILLIVGEPNWAIIVMLGAFLFDKLDGYCAREYGLSSEFGQQIDAFIDIPTYLVSAALLYHVALAPTVAASVVVGFVILAFGGLRLIRFTEEGFLHEDGISYYRGITVVHVNVLVLVNYFLAAIVPVWNGWIAGASIVLVSPVMISEYRSPKTVAAHWLLGIGGLVAIGLCLTLEFGYL